MIDLTVVVGGQYGSEAKGAVTAHLSRDFTDTDMVIRVAGPNAGHTAYDKDGREWKLRQVPVGAVSSPTSLLYLAAGSEIDLEVLGSEVKQLNEAGHHVTERLVVSPHATVIDERHKTAEAGLIGAIGSTGKGIGAARADRIMRNATTVEALNTQTVSDCGFQVGSPDPFDIGGLHRVIVEGTQGYGLGLHTPNYPQVTSSDCRAIDFLAMAGISPWHEQIGSAPRIVVVARCFPIRVAGNSGPLKGETSWEALGLPDERTTVTNKIRRVGAWDDDLLADAILANGGGGWNDAVQLAITMVDQRFPETAGVTTEKELSDEAKLWLREVENQHETEIMLVGTGPQSMFSVTLI